MLEEDDNTGGIVFATHAVTARRRGANLFNNDEFNGVSCRRTPWADQYAATGNVPASVAIAHGWWYECHGCGATINEDWLHENDLPLDGVVGFDRAAVFCSAICKAEQNLHDAMRYDHERRAIKLLEKLVLKRFPGVSFVRTEGLTPHAYATSHDGVWILEQASVSFDFPGMTYGPATLSVRRRYSSEIGPVRPVFSCCTGDQEAFLAFSTAGEVVQSESV